MKRFDHSLLKDPRYFSDGRMDAHADETYYRCEEEREDGKTSFRHSLNGLWKFHYARNYASAIPGFEEEAYSCKDWEDIYVPAHIQMEGYDATDYPSAAVVSVEHERKKSICFIPGSRERTGSVAQWKICGIQ